MTWKVGALKCQTHHIQTVGKHAKKQMTMNFDWDNKTRFKIFSLTVADRTGIQISALDVLYSNTDTFIEQHLQKEVQKQVDKFNKLDLSQVPEAELKEFTGNLSDYYGLSHETKEILSNY